MRFVFVLLAPTKATKMRMGATRTSCRSRTPSEVFPIGADNCRLSTNSCMTIAVEERAKANPISHATGAERPNSIAVTAMIIAHKDTCTSPVPRTIRLSAQSFSTDISKPNRKSRKSTPSSAKGATRLGSLMVK